MIDTEPRPSRLFVPNPPWRVGTVILGMGYTIFVIIVLIAIVGAFLVGLDIDDGTPAEINLSLIAQTAANLAILSGIFWFVRRGGAGPDDFGIRPWDYGRWWWIVVAFVIASYATLGGYALLIEQLDIEALEPESNVPDEIKDSAITLVLAAFFSILIAPVTEELFFGGCQAELRTGRGSHGQLAALWTRPRPAGSPHPLRSDRRIPRTCLPLHALDLGFSSVPSYLQHAQRDRPGTQLR
jgi:hypothetical protein